MAAASAIDLATLLRFAATSSFAYTIDPQGNAWGTATDMTGVIHAVECSPFPNRPPLCLAVVGLAMITTVACSKCGAGEARIAAIKRQDACAHACCTPPTGLIVAMHLTILLHLPQTTGNNFRTAWHRASHRPRRLLLRNRFRGDASNWDICSD